MHKHLKLSIFPFSSNQKSTENFHHRTGKAEKKKKSLDNEGPVIRSQSGILPSHFTCPSDIDLAEGSEFAYAQISVLQLEV